MKACFPIFTTFFPMITFSSCFRPLKAFGLMAVTLQVVFEILTEAGTVKEETAFSTFISVTSALAAEVTFVIL